MPHPGRFTPGKKTRYPFARLFNEFVSNLITSKSTVLEKVADTGLVKEFSHFPIIDSLPYLEMPFPPIFSYPGPK